MLSVKRLQTVARISCVLCVDCRSDAARTVLTSAGAHVLRSCARSTLYQQRCAYHPRMQDAITARAVAFPLYNAGSVSEFLDNERILGLGSDDAHPVQTATQPSSPVGALGRAQRHPQRLHTRLQLSTSPALRSFYTNAWGSLRIGRVLEDLDALAGSIALRHVALPDINTVTACVDKIRILQHHQSEQTGISTESVKPARSAPPWSAIHFDLLYNGHLFHVGNTSMTISCEVARADRDSPPFLEAVFVFVARDASGNKSIPVPGLLLATAADREAFARGEKLAAERRKSRLQQHRHAGLAASTSHQSSRESLSEHASASGQSEKARLDSSTVAPNSSANSVSIDETTMRTMHIVQPDVRNLFGFMFGGTVLLWSFELAYLTVLQHASMSLTVSKESARQDAGLSIVPRLVAIGDIDFHRPIPVGSILEMRSSIAGVRGDRVAVRLSVRLWSAGASPARIAFIEDANLITNTMTFLFQVPCMVSTSGISHTLRSVYPTTPEQAEESARALAMLESDT